MIKSQKRVKTQNKRRDWVSSGGFQILQLISAFKGKTAEKSQWRNFQVHLELHFGSACCIWKFKVSVYDTNLHLDQENLQEVWPSVPNPDGHVLRSFLRVVLSLQQGRMWEPASLYYHLQQIFSFYLTETLASNLEQCQEKWGRNLNIVFQCKIIVQSFIKAETLMAAKFTTFFHKLDSLQFKQSRLGFHLPQTQSIEGTSGREIEEGFQTNIRRGFTLCGERVKWQRRKCIFLLNK